MPEIFDGSSTVLQPLSSRFDSDKNKLRTILADSLRRSMAKLLDDRVHCDLQFETDDGTSVGAHRCVVKARALDFYNCYVHNCLNNNDSTVRIRNISGRRLKSFLRRVYTDENVPPFNSNFSSDSDNDADNNGRENEENDESKTPVIPEPVFENVQTEESYTVRRQETFSNENTSNLPLNNDIVQSLQISHESHVSHRTFVMDSNAIDNNIQDGAINNLKDQLSPKNENEVLKTSFVDLASSLISKDENDDLNAENDLMSSSQHAGNVTYRAPPGCGDRVMSSSADANRLSLSSGTGATNAKMFNMFIDLGTGRSATNNGIGSRSDAALNETATSFSMSFESEETARPIMKSQNTQRKRWSVNSIKSIDSSITELTTSPSSNVNNNILGKLSADGKIACSKLGVDLLSLLGGSPLLADTADFVLKVGDQEFKVHRAIIAATSAYFSELLNSELNSFTLPNEIEPNTLKYALSFLYGGVADIPEGANVWNVLDFARLIKNDQMISLAVLHIKSKLCHYFHKPCPSCVTNIVECIPKLRENKINDLLAKCLKWQARYFVRVWRCKAFQALDQDSLEMCCNALSKMTDIDNVVDILMGYEKLQHEVAAMTSKQAVLSANCAKKTTLFYENLLSDLRKSCLSFVARNFPAVLSSEAFLAIGKGYALNLGFVEDILPCIIHELSADNGCKALRALFDLISSITTQAEDGEYNERFISLLKRLYEMCDTHLIHKASQVLECESWAMLTVKMQQRIQEIGLFVDMRQPTALPPKLSSHNRSYKQRSSTSVDRTTKEDPAPKRRFASAKMSHTESIASNESIERDQKVLDASPQSVANEGENMQKLQSKRESTETMEVQGTENKPPAEKVVEPTATARKDVRKSETKAPIRGKISQNETSTTSHIRPPHAKTVSVRLPITTIRNQQQKILQNNPTKTTAVAKPIPRKQV